MYIQSLGVPSLSHTSERTEERNMAVGAVEEETILFLWLESGGRGGGERKKQRGSDLEYTAHADVQMV